MSYNKPDDELTFHVFDKWDEVLPFRERLAICEEIVNGFTFETHNRLVMAETQLIDSLDDLWTFYETQTLLGHEGIIIRGPDTYYKFGRGAPTVGELIKMKEGGWIDTEVRIINFHEERENTNEATINELGYTERSGHQDNLIGKGTLGAFEVEGKFEDGRPFTCRVGTGLDHATRQAVWNDKEGYRSKLVKMSYFNVGIKDKPRFPKFLGFRDPDDMDPEQMDLFS
jgi:DNA ligase-1